MLDQLKSWDILGGWSYVVLLVFLLGYAYYQIWGRTPADDTGGDRFVNLNPPLDTSEGWKADPLRPGKLRYWDGANWTAREGVPAKASASPEERRLGDLPE